jgi:DNA (cytosine-5)-methyltransferase 1
MMFGSVCSGIEAASVAWHPLGWKAAWLAEIEPFPCAVLAHHYPTVPNLGDMTTIARRVLTGEVEAPDVLTGGTPCQAFSVAGLRESLADERGNLTLKFVELADAIDHVRGRAGKPASVVVWENVPGVLSTKDNAFGCFLAGLAGEDDALEPPGGRWSDSGCVYGPQRAVAWRTLDAQYFGLAQRRRRVFVVASARAGFDPAQVLFEWQGVRRDSAPSRQAGEGTAAATAPSLTASGRGVERSGESRGQDPVVAVHAPEIARCVATREGSSQDWETTTMVAHSLRGEGFDASEDGTGRGTPLVPVAVSLRGREGGGTAELGDEVQNALRASGGGGDKAHILAAMQVRRLTPTECARLQGFPDDYLDIDYRGKPAADGPKYKALGNSWAVPVARWVGRRIQQEIA